MKKQLVSKSKQKSLLLKHNPNFKTSYKKHNNAELNKLLEKANEINQKMMIKNPFFLPPDYDFNSDNEDPADTSNMGEDLKI